ncbi:MAG TPA: glycosyltransferase family 2 protein [Chryseolinea sp.]|nr:glycosyltransferase family 2 protein [Chryseolinea sp.]HPM31868.1 glycosyltransferase family 2 protein [Chryseolinea sp.]
MKISVIISTYNHPEWLEKVLWGYECQTYKNFEVIIADDGSGEPTRLLVDRFKKSSSLDINHVWHEDVGYQKCQILNKSILAAATDYLLFTDGDCIPRMDFVEQHVSRAEKGFFLSGGAIRLPMETSKLISQDDVVTQRAFNRTWLEEKGLEKKFLKNLKLTPSKGMASFMNFITPANASWNGGNASGWKSDLLSINGFDERMEYGGQDRELGERMMNKGVKSKQLRYSAICVHLDHSRGYKTDSSVQKNVNIRKVTRGEKKVWTEFGIRKESGVKEGVA